MKYLVIGGSASGKSEYAESIAVSFGTPRFYIATMQPFGKETKERIEKHRAMRRFKNFETIECYTSLSSRRFWSGGTYLLECMSNLVANEMFSPSGAKENTVEEIIKGIENLGKSAENLIVVTNDVFANGVNYPKETTEYLNVLAEINRLLAKQFDVVTEVVCGIPVGIKVEPNK